MQRITKPVKPPAIGLGSTVRVIFPASPTDSERLERGIGHLEQCGYRVLSPPKMQPDGYFAGSLATRRADVADALTDAESDVLICARGGYGSSALLSGLLDSAKNVARTRNRGSRSRVGFIPKLVIGYSDVTALQIFLWQRLRWVTLYGPMVAAGLDHGPDQRDGYDRASFLNATSGEKREWSIGLKAKTLVGGIATGVLLGGCLTLLQTTIGTPWELDTRGAILLLEDCTIKPYQLDRMLTHLAQSGKLRDVRGIVLGEFPGCEPPASSRETVLDACRRVLGHFGIPVVFGAPVGHTPRPMLTIPLGVRARLTASREGKLEILEPAVSPRK